MLSKVTTYVVHHPVVKKASRKGESYIHVTYCVVLFIEGHGLYALVGGVLGVAVLFNILINGGDGE